MVKKHETKELTKTIKAINIEIKAYKAFLRIHLILSKQSGPSTGKASGRSPPSKPFTTFVLKPRINAAMTTRAPPPITSPAPTQIISKYRPSFKLTKSIDMFI